MSTTATDQAARMTSRLMAAGLAGYCDPLGYVWCVKCRPTETADAADNPGGYPVPIHTDATCVTDECESCGNNL